MTVYKCDICNLSTNIKSHYNRHLKTKKHMVKSNNIGVCNTNATQMQHNATIMQQLCNNNATQMQQLCNTNATQEKYICNYCSKNFKTHQSYYRHMKHYCKGNKIEKKLSFKDRQDLIDFVKNELLDELSIVPINKDNTNSNNIINSNTNNNNNNITNNNTTNITIKNFGCENISHLTDEFKYEMIKSPYDMMKPLIKAIHLDPKAPENRNIIIENIKEKRVLVFENGEWQYKELDYILGDMVDAKYYLIDVFYSEKKENEIEEFNKNVSDIQDKRYIRFRNEYDNMNETLVDKLKTDCRNTLYFLRKDFKGKI
jgi:ribosomal protein S6